MNKSEKKSSQPGTEKEKADQILQKSSYSGKTPRQIMRKHIRDKDDVITEDDFKNLNISTDISNDTSEPPLVIADDNDRPKDEDKDHAIVTPWDVIS